MLTIDQFVTNEVIYNQTMLVLTLLEKGSEGDKKINELGFNFDEITNYHPKKENGEYDEDGDYPEIFSWYLVTDWFGRHLGEKGECVLETNQGTYWGRQSFGQMISMDSVIKEIYEEEILNYKK